MAGLEVVVRPVVFPNIRPTPARVLPPEDDPTKGFAVIRGNPGKQVDLTFSTSISTSKSRGVETERRVDEMRVYQVDDDGKVNKKNFVNVEVANRIKSRGAKGPAVDTSGPGFGTPGTGSNMTWEERQDFYKKAEETENIEKRKTDVIKKNPDAKE